MEREAVYDRAHLRVCLLGNGNELRQRDERLQVLIYFSFNIVFAKGD